ncbi:serine/threonine kinase [Schistosoma mansoni]|uniref:serine/threonine kinase n=1 Tax=Schistosoma mansoni TaxID=6183 RepID=UPI00022DC779|nr:serine/threonine kinase [Schistosoma mansoni]|eukprot:XP_018651526.1 serine/threonine kinase [Schistosoma mansoni]
MPDISISDYQFIKTIGKGSYGEVWLCRHKTDTKKYVIKKIDVTKSSDKERKAAKLECRLLSEFRHPNIVQYKTSFEYHGFLYIAMGFCEGGDLYTRLRMRNGVLLSERVLVEWFVQLAIALQYMHERNVLHRDLKTRNIFLTRSNIVKLGDLGIARVLESSNSMATTLIGTPYYMSPELFANKPYNHKSDIWALGCVLYEMSTLRHAFNAKSFNALSYKILSGKIPDMPTQYSPELLELMRAMLHLKPEKRPSARRVLSNSFIRKHIVLFLEATKDRATHSQNHSTIEDEVQNTSQHVECETGVPPITHQSANEIKMKQNCEENSQLVSKQTLSIDRNDVYKQHERQIHPSNVNCIDELKDDSLHRHLSDARLRRRQRRQMSEVEEVIKDQNIEQLLTNQIHCNISSSPSSGIDQIKKNVLECKSNSTSQTKQTDPNPLDHILSSDQFKDISRKENWNDNIQVYSTEQDNRQNDINNQLVHQNDDKEIEAVVNCLADTLKDGCHPGAPAIIPRCKNGNKVPTVLANSNNCLSKDQRLLFKPNLEDNGPIEPKEETINRSVHLKQRFVELHRECIKNVGLKRLHEAYEILDQDVSSESQEVNCLEFIILTP